MPPRNSTPSGLEPKSESLEGVLSAIRSLAEVVEKHVSTSGTVKPKDAEIEGCTIEQFRKLGPPSFLGNPDPTEAESWIMQMEKIFDVIGCTEVQKVSFASFMLKGVAKHWWRSTKKTVPLEEDEILTWTVFLDAFYEKYFPESVRDEKEVEFMELIQGNKTVLQYEAKFTELSRFAPHIVADDVRRAKKFQRGLRPSIRTRMAALRLKSYSEVVETAKVVEKECEDYQRIRNQNNKRPKTEGFHGGNEHNKPFKKKTTTEPETKMVQQVIEVCQKCGKKHKGVCYRESGACFKCGQMGHRIKDCPSMKSELMAKPTEVKQRPKVQGRVFAITEQDAKASKSVVTGTIPIFSHTARVLIDPGSTHSFVSCAYMKYADCVLELLDFELSVSTPLGKTMVAEFICKSCVIKIGGNELLADLILLEIQEFDVILGMDWLAAYHANVDCYKKEVVFCVPGRPEFVFHGSRESLVPNVISAIHANKLLRKGCKGYLAYVVNNQKEGIKIDDIPIVRDFVDVFPEDLPGLPFDREIEFAIDLVPGTAPISMAPYRMAPAELKELKLQLQELLEKGFIRPSVSPWGAPVLFVKKKDGSMRLCIDYR